MPELTKDQRNQIYRAVASTRLNPAECSFEVVSTNTNQITHNPSRSWFQFVVAPGTDMFHAVWRIGDDPIPSGSGGNDFQAVVNLVQGWAERVFEWMELPDLWEMPDGRNSIPGDLTADSANSPFTLEEQKAIADQLSAIAETIKQTYQLTAEQSAALDEKFGEAAKASERMGRKDWGLLFGGAVFSLILADVITPGVAGHILMMVEHGIGHLFAGDPPPVGGILARGK